MGKTKYLSVFIALVFILISAMPVLSAPKDSARVWVEFSPGKKAAVQGFLKKQGAQFHYTFDDLSAFVITLPEQALTGIVNNPNVVAIEEDVPRYLIGASTGQTMLRAASVPEDQEVSYDDTQIVPYGVEMVLGEKWNDQSDGTGIKVCIIDTGYYREHLDLPDDSVTGESQIDEENWYDDGYGHGTHVAGTIAGKNDGFGVVGVSPGVSLHIIKIFDNNGDWVTYSSDLAAAALSCQDAQSDIISMSLGGSKSREEERVFNTLYDAGILSVAAAGNDGDRTLSYPASYDSVISVAAVDSTETVADFSQYNRKVELAAPGVGVLSTVPYITTEKLVVGDNTYNAYGIEYSAYTAAETPVGGALVDGYLCGTTNPNDWDGKIVVCERGEFSFNDKVMNVQDSGGVAAVIYNNESGDFLGTLGDGNSSTIPAISLSMENGLLVLKELELSGEIELPGEVFHELPYTGSGYEAWDGTSMATPHVSAVAALLWSAEPGATNSEIREAMVATAIDLGETGRDNYYGYGLVQAYDALMHLSGGTQDGELSVGVEKNADIYTKGDTVEITSTVTDGKNPVQDASVEVVIDFPNGNTATMTAVTDSFGVAVVNYRINTKKTGIGTAIVTSSATKVGYTEGSNTTDFAIE